MSFGQKISDLHNYDCKWKKTNVSFFNLWASRLLNLHNKSLLTYLQIRKCQLNAEDTRNLLVCFVWVLKNVDKALLKQWWTDIPINRLNCILEIIYFAVSNFEYRVSLQDKTGHGPRFLLGYNSLNCIILH